MYWKEADPNITVMHLHDRDGSGNRTGMGWCTQNKKLCKLVLYSHMVWHHKNGSILHSHWYNHSKSNIRLHSTIKYIIILRSDLSWADQVNYTVKKAWKSLHFTMWILKKGNSNTKSLAYMSLVCLILEYGAACWDTYREGQIIALDKVQKKAAKFAHHTNSPNWETLVSHRKLSRICALFKAYSGERVWKPIGDRLQRPQSRSRRQRTDIGKYSFVTRTIQHWNQSPAEVLGTLSCKPITFKKTVRKVIVELN